MSSIRSQNSIMTPNQKSSAEEHNYLAARESRRVYGKISKKPNCSTKIGRRDCLNLGDRRRSRRPSKSKQDVAAGKSTQGSHDNRRIGCGFPVSFFYWMNQMLKNDVRCVLGQTSLHVQSLSVFGSRGETRKSKHLTDDARPMLLETR